MVIAVSSAEADQAIAVLTSQGETAWKIGTIESDPASVKDADEKIRVIFA